MTAARTTALAGALLLLPAAAMSVAAQQVLTGTVTASGEPVADARLELRLAADTTAAPAARTTSGTDGRYRLTGLAPDRYVIVASRLGFAPVRRAVTLGAAAGQRLDIVMRPAPVALTATVTSATLREVFAGDAPVKVEVLTGAFLKRNAGTNLMDNLSFVNGLNQQVDCGVCFTNNIRINGMEGPYTAVLIDGAPIMSALASVYGLNGIDPALVEQVEIIKGPSSTLHGSEAMGGLINVVTKDPRFAPRWSVQASTSSHGEHTLAVAGAPRLGGARGLLSVSTAYNDRFVDGNVDGFTDLPLVRRLSVFNKWTVGDAAHRSLDLAGRLYMEDRFGGVRGWTSADRGTDRAYGESIRTTRMELVGSYRFPSLGDRLRVDAALNRHDQDSWYGLQPYQATQTTAFAQLIGRPPVGDRHDVAIGVALRAQGYRDSTRHHQSDDHHLTPGIFAQDEIALGESWTVLAGLRVDHHDAHGIVPSPRLAVKWDADAHTTVRLNAATGFRVVNLFTEEHQALSGAREVVLAEELRPERSMTLTASVHREVEVGGVPDALTVDVDAYHTRFTNRILADFDSDPDRIIYGNLDGWARTRGIAVAAGYRTEQRPFSANVGLTWQEVTVQDGGVLAPLPYAPRLQGVFTVGYNVARLRTTVDWTGRLLGPMALPRFAGFPDRSPWFGEHHVQATYAPRPGVELYGALKNALGFVQRDAIIAPHDPFGPDFDPGRVYGPLQGRRLVVGARWAVGR
ncbi:MAG: TonB-dependent receptor [Gemmatimonadaceae bacterium]